MTTYQHSSAFLFPYSGFKFRVFQLKVAAQKRQSTLKKDAGSWAFSRGGCMQRRTLCPHWELLKKDAGAQKKTLCGHEP